MGRGSSRACRSPIIRPAHRPDDVGRRLRGCARTMVPRRPRSDARCIGICAKGAQRWQSKLRRDSRLLRRRRRPDASHGDPQRPAAAGDRRSGAARAHRLRDHPVGVQHVQRRPAQPSRASPSCSVWRWPTAARPGARRHVGVPARQHLRGGRVRVQRGLLAVLLAARAVLRRAHPRRRARQRAWAVLHRVGDRHGSAVDRVHADDCSGQPDACSC